MYTKSVAYYLNIFLNFTSSSCIIITTAAPSTSAVSAVSLRCGPSGVSSDSPLDWSSFHTGCRSTVSPPCGRACVSSGLLPDWSASRTVRSHTAFPPYDSAGGFVSSPPWWTSSHRQHTSGCHLPWSPPSWFSSRRTKSCWVLQTHASSVRCASSGRGRVRTGQRQLVAGGAQQGYDEKSCSLSPHIQETALEEVEVLMCCSLSALLLYWRQPGLPQVDRWREDCANGPMRQNWLPCLHSVMVGQSLPPQLRTSLPQLCASPPQVELCNIQAMFVLSCIQPVIQYYWWFPVLCTPASCHGQVCGCSSAAALSVWHLSCASEWHWSSARESLCLFFLQVTVHCQAEQLRNEANKIKDCLI